MKVSLHKGPGEGVLSRSEFSEELHKRLCAEALDTPSITMVANRVGLPVSRIYYWVREGLNGNPRFAAFAHEFVEARAKHEDRYMKNLEDLAADDNPKVANARLNALKFLLQKHFPDQYADFVKVQATTTNQTNYNLAVLPPERLRQFHTMLKAVIAGDEDDAQAERFLRELPMDVQEATD